MPSNKYPEWYEKRIVQGEPKQKSKKQGGTWVCNEALYEWWKRKITEEVKAGGRYFSIMALCSYGLKCGISEQKIRRDAYAFLDHLESLTEDEDNHFSRADVKDALRALKGDRKRLSTIASREWIEDTDTGAETICGRHPEQYDCIRHGACRNWKNISGNGNGHYRV